MFSDRKKNVLLITGLFILIVSLSLVGCRTTATKPPTEPSGPSEKKGKASLSVVSPKEGETVTGATVSVEVKTSGVELVEPGVANDPKEGHLHYTLDDETKMSGENVMEFTGVSSGSHALNVELVQNDHTSRSPAVKKTVTFTVSGGGGSSGEGTPSPPSYNY